MVRCVDFNTLFGIFSRLLKGNDSRVRFYERRAALMTSLSSDQTWWEPKIEPIPACSGKVPNLWQK